MHEVDTTKLYQDYPHLKQIDELWGTPAGRDLLIELMSDTRDGKRVGFSHDHGMTLLALLTEHDRQFPQFDTINIFAGIVRTSDTELQEKDEQQQRLIEAMRNNPSAPPPAAKTTAEDTPPPNADAPKPSAPPDDSDKSDEWFK